MAIRQEELLVTEAIVYRFPTHMVRARRAREIMLRRRRRVLGMVAVLVAAGLLIGWAPTTATPARAGDGPSRIVVAPGETLWDLAETHAPDSMDPRAYVDELQDLNGLSGPIRPGMRLKLPR